LVAGLSFLIHPGILIEDIAAKLPVMQILRASNWQLALAHDTTRRSEQIPGASIFATDGSWGELHVTIQRNDLLGMKLEKRRRQIEKPKTISEEL